MTKKQMIAALVEKYGYEEKLFEKYTYDDLKKALSYERDAEVNYDKDGAILFPNGDRDHDAEDEDSFP